VRRDVALAAVLDEVLGVVALVATDRDAALARHVIVEHLQGVATLGVAVGDVHLQVEHQAVAIFDEARG
jgi:hypothetical protein